MTQHILEGTPQELVSYLAQRPHGRFRLVELSEEAGAPTQSVSPLPDPQNASSIALLKSWLEEDATDDPEEIRAAEEDLREFKRNMNLPRKEAGARLLYPEVEEASDPKELDGDVLIAAQALDTGLPTTDFIIATVNVGHLSLFVPADLWTNIIP